MFFSNAKTKTVIKVLSQDGGCDMSHDSIAEKDKWLDEALSEDGGCDMSHGGDKWLQRATDGCASKLDCAFTYTVPGAASATWCGFNFAGTDGAPVPMSRSNKSMQISLWYASLDHASPS